MNTIKHRAENLNNGGSVTVYYCGYEKCEGGHFWGPAVRNQYLLHYVISGKGTYTVGEETYTLHANECFLIRPGERTYYIADREDPWEYMWVAFDGFDVLEILRRTGLVSQYTTKLENGDEFIRYMHEMIDEFNKGSLFKVMSGFYGAMSVLEESAHGGAYTREHEYVNKAIAAYRHRPHVSLPHFLRFRKHVAEAIFDAGAHQCGEKNAAGWYIYCQ